jgi:hypothetical protein
MPKIRFANVAGLAIAGALLLALVPVWSVHAAPAASTPAGAPPAAAATGPAPAAVPATPSLRESATATAAPAGQQLDESQIEKLVAPIALYPDDLVGLVIASSLYPIQIVEAERFLEQHQSKPDLKPNPNWDGSVWRCSTIPISSR